MKHIDPAAGEIASAAPSPAPSQLVPEPIGAVAAEAPKPTQSALAWLTHAGAMLALAACATALFGFGVVAGMTSSVDLDPGELINNTSDLLTLFWPGLLDILLMLGKLDWPALTERIAILTALVAVFAAILMLLAPAPARGRALMSRLRRFLDDSLGPQRRANNLRERARSAGVGAVIFGLTGLLMQMASQGDGR